MSPARIYAKKIGRGDIYFNCPMIVLSPVIPHPIKFLLWELSNGSTTKH